MKGRVEVCEYLHSFKLWLTMVAWTVLVLSVDVMGFQKGSLAIEANKHARGCPE